MIKNIQYKNKNLQIYTSFINDEIRLFIISVFKENYDANIEYFEDYFLVLKDDNNNILSVLGFKYYSYQNFLVEKYLNKNIYEIIGYHIDAKKILEIGNLSSIDSDGYGSLLIFNSIEYILNTNADVAFITATKRVKNILKKYNIIFSVLGDANKESLPSSSHWGKYYEQKTELIQIDLIQTRNNLLLEEIA